MSTCVGALAIRYTHTHTHAHTVSLYTHNVLERLQLPFHTHTHTHRIIIHPQSPYRVLFVSAWLRPKGPHTHTTHTHTHSHQRDLGAPCSDLCTVGGAQPRPVRSYHIISYDIILYYIIINACSGCRKGLSSRAPWSSSTRAASAWPLKAAACRPVNPRCGGGRLAGGGGVEHQVRGPAALSCPKVLFCVVYSKVPNRHKRQRQEAASS
jgi:hypothetical protein